ncbi:hypothetical protein [Donghicola mangrovi]|uniref:DUF3108 domain-containing protein n=1 Tax=Donghicola mangrovi TaxID=2729614 RepID=A0A850Q2C7_9RHOB|nr:hypothetical protein [Donghicola mangrovi]NVO23124.1 hypothetical protein [Donghicola mangrovi]
MRKKLVSLALLCALAAPVQAAMIDGNALYETLFRSGTLEGVTTGSHLVYTRTVTNAAKPETATRDTGTVVLTLEQGDALMANLEFRQEEKHRSLGSFPASVGNPMIMYFAETVARDMAETAGGSPFYIRNRLKESLVSAADLTEGQAQLDGTEIAVKTVVLHPFANDPNRGRMNGFEDLELIVAMSDAVPGYYLSLTAATPEGSPAGYHSETRFTAVEAAR